MEDTGTSDNQPKSDSAHQTGGTGSAQGMSDGEEDLYIKFKKLQKQIEFLQVRI